MSLVVPNVIEDEMLNDVIAGRDPMTLHLYKTNVTPGDMSVAGSFTEADFSGYASLTIAMATAISSGGKGVSVDGATRDFTHNGGGTANTVYGYYVLDAGGTLAWAEKFSAPVSMSAAGNKISITCQLTLDSENH